MVGGQKIHGGHGNILGVPIVRVFFHAHPVVDSPGLQLVGPVANQVARTQPMLSMLFHTGHMHWPQGGESAEINKIRRGLGQNDFELVIRQRSHSDLAPIAGPFLVFLHQRKGFRPFNAIKQIGIGRSGFWAQSTSPAGYKIMRGHWITIGPTSFGPQVEQVAAALLRNFPMLRDARYGFSVLIKIGETLK